MPFRGSPPRDPVACSKIHLPVPRHLEEAAERLAAAERRIVVAKELPLSLESLQEWIAALTDYAAASSDIQRFTNESVHEKLHELAGRAGIRPFPTSSSDVVT